MQDVTEGPTSNRRKTTYHPSLLQKIEVREDGNLALTTFFDVLGQPAGTEYAPKNGHPAEVEETHYDLYGNPVRAFYGDGHFIEYVRNSFGDLERVRSDPSFPPAAPQKGGLNVRITSVDAAGRVKALVGPNLTSLVGMRAVARGRRPMSGSRLGLEV